MADRGGEPFAAPGGSARERRVRGLRSALAPRPPRVAPSANRVTSRAMSAVSEGPRAGARAGGDPAGGQLRRRHLVRRPAWRLPESREDRLAVIGLAALLVVGALLRLLFIFAWRPALFGWPDAASYIEVSQGAGGAPLGNAELFGNPLRPAGYPLFLRVLHGIAPSLLFVVVLQHLLGLASAALLYLTVARTGVPRPLGLVPAAVVALGGDIMFVEHAPISEALFIFLVASGLYAAVRSQEGEHLRWPAICGLTFALAASVRVVAVPLLVVVGLWLLVGTRLALRRRLTVLAVGAAAALGLLGTYYAIQERAVGRTGLSPNGIWNVYGRVAPFADCSKFTPPPGTEPLCETTPRSQRPFTHLYTFNWYYSPGVRIFGNPHTASVEQTDQVAAFTWAVIVGQPLDYAEEVGAGLLRYVAPESFRGYGGGPSYHDLVNKVLFHRRFQREGLVVARRHYADAGGFSADHRLIEVLRTYESATRIQGPLFVLIALLSVIAPFLTRGHARGAALLFALAGWTLLVTPVATVEFSARTGLPGFGPLCAAAALGGWRVLAAVRGRKRRSGAGGSLAEPV